MTKKSAVSINNEGLESVNKKLNEFLKTLSGEEKEAFLVVLSKAASTTPENAESAKEIYRNISPKKEIEAEDLANSLQGQGKKCVENSPAVWVFTFWSFSF